MPRPGSGFSSRRWTAAGFAHEAAEKFTLFRSRRSARNMLPTHSDLLDLLANGGLLGFRPLRPPACSLSPCSPGGACCARR